MKKLISLAVVLSLVLCMAAAAFATEPELGSIENPIVVSDPSEMASVDIPAGTILWFSLPAEWSGMILSMAICMACSGKNPLASCPLPALWMAGIGS